MPAEEVVLNAVLQLVDEVGQLKATVNQQGGKLDDVLDALREHAVVDDRRFLLLEKRNDLEDGAAAAKRTIVERLRTYAGPTVGGIAGSAATLALTWLSQYLHKA